MTVLGQGQAQGDGARDLDPPGPLNRDKDAHYNRAKHRLGLASSLAAPLD